MSFKYKQLSKIDKNCSTLKNGLKETKQFLGGEKIIITIAIF